MVTADAGGRQIPGRNLRYQSPNVHKHQRRALSARESAHLTSIRPNYCWPGGEQLEDPAGQTLMQAVAEHCPAGQLLSETSAEIAT